jgi:hypothetical protein
MPPKKKKSAQALDAFKGFTAQPARMALLLLSSPPGSSVSLELFEDVGVERHDGTKFASQMKVGKTNPVADRAEPLWKTFGNWVHQVKNRQLDPTRTRFELYVSKHKAGKLVRKLNEAGTTTAAAEAVRLAREVLWGESPGFPKKAAVARTLAPHLEELFGTEAGMRALEAVALRFHLNLAEKSPVEELHNHLRDVVMVAPAVLEKVLCHYYGWVEIELQRQIHATGAAPVMAGDLARAEFSKFYQSLVSGGRLPDVANEPTTADYFRLLHYQFIRQLELINAENETRTFAMTVFFKAATARTIWVDHDLVREESMRALDQLLEQAHRDFCSEIEAAGQGPEQFGRKLLAKCHLHRCPVEQKDPPEYFIPGSFHALADALRVGWHPEFKKLLQTVA